MDSEIISPLCSHQKNKNIVVPDDSGYFTVTPSSAESTAYGESICRDISFDTSHSRILSYSDSSFNASYSTTGSTCKKDVKLISDGIKRQISFKRQNAIEEEMECADESIHSMEIEDTESKIVVPKNEEVISNISDYDKLYSKDDFQNVIQKTPSSKSGSGDTKLIRKQLSKPEKNKLNHINAKVVKSVEKRKSLKKGLSKDEKRKFVKNLDFSESKCENDEGFDILNKLNGKPSSIDDIFKHCKDKDLQNVYNVSLTWRGILRSSKVADNRRINWLRWQVTNKENNVPKSMENNKKSNLIYTRSAFSQNNSQATSMEEVEIKSPPTSPRTKNVNLYYKTAKSNLSSELRRCPCCNKPAVLNGARFICEGPGCKFPFCGKCFGEYVDRLHICPIVEGFSPSKDEQPQSENCDRADKEKAKKNLRNKNKLKRRLYI